MISIEEREKLIIRLAEISTEERKKLIIKLALSQLARVLYQVAFPDQPLNFLTKNEEVYQENLRNNLSEKIDVNAVFDIVYSCDNLDNLADKLDKMVSLSKKDEWDTDDFSVLSLHISDEYRQMHWISFLLSIYLAQELEKKLTTEAEAKELAKQLLGNTKPAKFIEPRLFSDRNLEPTPSCAIVDTVFSFCVGKNLTWKNLTEELATKKKYTNGTVELIIKQAEKTILHEYGLDTVKVFYTLMSYSLKHKNSLNEFITVSGWELLSYFKKQSMRDNTGKKRISKKDSLEWVAGHCELLKKINVFIGSWKQQGKKNFSVKEAPLINFDLIDYNCQLDIYGNPDKRKINDLEITYKAGGWFNYFLSENPIYLKQFGYIHKEVLALNSRNNLGARIGHLLPVKLEQNSSGKFKIRTVLEQTGEKPRIESILTESNSRKAGRNADHLKRDWEYAIEQLTTINDPYGFSYVNPPAWVSSDTRKPRGWFKQWLDLTVVFTKPACLPSRSYRDSETDKPKNNAGERLTYLDVLEALNRHKDNKNVSIRKLTTCYGKKHPWLQKRLREDAKPKLTQSQIEDLLNKIEFLAKKKIK